MSSWVLQLALLAACLRLGCPEGDPLPAALVELVRSSPITSIQDLQLLLLTDSVEEDPDSQSSKGLHSNGTFSRLPRSLDAEPAQQALCKVRTEVQEVTRTMLDRRNANFMLWPPCVEVQRCSGCCNARTLQCVPVITQTRYLQVMKIQYVSGRPHYDKAIISIQDHVECHCQNVPLPKASRTSSKRQHHPRRQTPKDALSRSHSKEELHRRDEHKWNQNFQSEEGPSRYHPLPQAPPRGDNVLPGHGRTMDSRARFNRLGTRNLTEQQEVERALLLGLGLRRPVQDMGVSGVVLHGLNATKEPSIGRHPPWLNLTENATQGRRRGPQYDPVERYAAENERSSDRSLAADTWDPETRAYATQSPLQLSTASQPLRRRLATGAGEIRHPKTPHWGRPSVSLEHERGALALLQRKLELESRRIKILQRQQHHQPHHPPTQTHTTTQMAVTSQLPTTTRPPPETRAPAPPAPARTPAQTPARKRPPKRRVQRTRQRISKAAMRAMLM
ncbi:hypothetical protein GJAV_G00222860 [Gymnothorax javanicus]|nr:hypothetical protein GJAV_G00222860 [Gymnothorax javanicus]